MKKYLYLSIFLLSALSIISCGDEKKEKEEPSKWFMAQTELATVSNVSATSELVEAQFAGSYLYPPVNIVDGDLESTWCEADEHGSGIGEAITIEFAEALSFDEIQVVNGFASKKHSDLYMKNNRVKAIQLTQIAGEHFQTKEYILEDNQPDWQSIKFDLPQTAQFVEIKINDIYPGNKYDDTCFDDIRFLYEGKIIPFAGVKELKKLQEENSKAMLKSDFDGKFSALFTKKDGENCAFLRQTGKDWGIKIVGSGKDFDIYDISFSDNNIVYQSWYGNHAKLGNCRLTVNQKIDYVEVKTVKLIKIDGNSVNINGVQYKLVDSTKLTVEVY